VLEPSVLDRIEGGRKVSVEREVFPAMVAAGTLFAQDDASYWIDTGTPQEYIQAQLDLLDGLRGGEAARAAIHETAAVDPAARVSRSVVGPDATLAAGARVEGSVLLEGARIGPGAVVEGSVVGAGTEVGEGAEIVGCTVVGDTQVIGPGERLDGARLPEACE
jgi:mannose-1-phosphate guanylyltransferase